MDGRIYNPLDKENLGTSVVDALLKTEELPLGDLRAFLGVGIYAIYYRGSFQPYARLADQNEHSGTVPIYVGKAVPKGSRKGIVKNVSLGSNALYRRLKDHLESIVSAANLNPEEFSFRYLIVDEIWIGLGEALLIQRYRPLWNQVVDGFGNHNPGRGRLQGRKPLWDVLHPGRPWAERCASANIGEDEVIERILKHLR